MKKRLEPVDYLLIVFCILTILVVGFLCEASEPDLSMYDSVSDKTMTVVECSWADGSRPDQRLLVKNTEVDNNKVTLWFLAVCLGRPR